MKRTKLLGAIALFSLLPLLAPAPAAAQNDKRTIRERQENQKERIEDGVKDGELTRREAAKLRTEQEKIRAEKKVARADGEVTAEERAKIRQDQNKASRNIRRQKHDNQERKR